MASGVSDGALIVDTGINNSGFIKDAKTFTNAVRGLKTTVDQVGRAMANSGNGYINALGRSAKSTRELNAVLKQTEAEAQRVKAAMDEMAGAKVSTDARQRIAKDLQSLTEKYKSLKEKRDLALYNDNDKAYQSYTNQMAQVASRVRELRSEYQKLVDSGNAFVSGDQTETFQKLSQNYDMLVNKIRELREAGRGGLSGAFASVASSASQAAASIARLAGGTAWKFLQKLASGAKNAAVQLAKLAARAAASSIKRLGSLFSGAAKSAWGFFRNMKKGNSGGGGLQVSLKNLLRYGLGIRSLFVLFNRLRSAIKEGFAALAEQNPEVKASLGALSAALNGLKMALASAFAPILTAVTPALVALINLVTQAANAVGMLMAALTGKGFYSAAKGVASVGKAAGGAAGGVKKLNRELAGFDELTILKDNQSGGGGGGGGGGAGKQMFETVPVDSGIAEFVEHIKELFGEEKFEEIGGIIAGGINTAFEKALALLRGVYGAKIGTSIGEFLNGLFGDKLDWDVVGTTIGEALGVQLEIVGSTLGTFDLGKAVQGASTAFQAFSKTLSARMRRIPWTTIGQNFANGINSLFTLKNFMAAKQLLATALNGVFGAISEAVKGIKWGQIGSDLGTALSDFINNDIDWNAVADAFTAAVKGIFEFGSGFLDEFEADKAAENLKNALKKVPWGEIADAAWEFLSKALKKAGDFITVLFGGDVAEDAKDAVEAVEQMWDRHDGTTTSAAPKGLADTILSAIKSAFDKIPWSEWGEKIRDFVENDIPWQTIFEGILGIFESVLSGASKLLDGILFGGGEGSSQSNAQSKFTPTALLGIFAAAKGIKWGGTLLKGLISGSGGSGGLFAGAMSKLGLFGLATAAVGGAGVYAGNKAYEYIDEKYGAVIQDLLDKFVKDFDEYKKSHELEPGKKYEGSGDPVQDVLTYWIEGTKGLDKLSETVQSNTEAIEKKTNTNEFENMTPEQFVTAANILKNLGYKPEEILYEYEKRGVSEENLNAIWESLHPITEEQATELGAALTDGTIEGADAEMSAKEWEIKEIFGELYVIAKDVNEVNSPSKLFEALGVDIVAGLVNGLNTLPKALTGVWEKLPEWARTLLGEAHGQFGVNLTGDSDGQRMQRQTNKELKQNTKALKKLKGKKTLLGLDTSGLNELADGTQVKVGVNFVPGSDKATDSDKDGDKDKNANSGLLGWLQQIFDPGVGVDVAVSLIRNGWSSIGEFIGTFLTVLLGLGKSGWDSLGGFIGTFLTVLLGLGKSGWTTLGGFIGTFLTVLLGLGKSGWTTLGGFIGTALTVLLSLGKSGWTSLGGFIGTALTILLSLGKSGWTTITQFFGLNAGDIFKVFVSLFKGKDWNPEANDAMTTGDKKVKTERSLINGTIDDTANKAMTIGDLQNTTWRNVLNGAVDVLAQAAFSIGDTQTTTRRNVLNGVVDILAAAAFSIGDTQTTTRRNVLNGAVDILAEAALSIGDTKTTTFRNLKKGDKWSSEAESALTVKDGSTKTTTTKVNLVAGKISEFASKIGEGIKDAIGNVKSWLGIATGGAISAGGHLTRFAAGGAVSKAGAMRWWNHVPKYAGGTSRAHGTMFVAGEAGPEIVGHINGKTEILNKSQLASTMYAAVQGGMLAALKGIQFRMPVMATGSVTPYAVASEAAQRDRALQDTMNNNNEDLIQAMVSAIGNAANAIITAVQAQGGNNHIAGLTSRQVLDEFNRAAMMYAASPLKGV